MRHYSNNAIETTLDGDHDALTPQIRVKATTGYPAQVPYTLLLAPDAGAEEIVLVTRVLSNVDLQVTRGWGGTQAQAHKDGTKVRHGAVAEDFREAALAFQQLFGPPVYDPNDPSKPPTNAPVLDANDLVKKSADTWGDLL